ncbi:uncharacterized protein LOC127241496 isoform X2 [Andrographis paniculata]|uniref:uncharacterized protein LOC127241496 isoform X2 n=1 Tax=Andrographis paniculata TaxID=175694 RepID=UPI0021E8C6AA|nr:uncharacterized protein LOC127241496 isoform X2 [Andrographis paniculata]
MVEEEDSLLLLLQPDSYSLQLQQLPLPLNLNLIPRRSFWTVRYLKKSQENKAKNDKERLDSYYKRNYKDYFESIEGTLRQKDNKDLTQSEKAILEWLDSNRN